MNGWKRRSSETSGGWGMNANLQMTEYGPMTVDYRCSSISELCVENAGVQTGPFGSQLHKEDYVEHGTPIITVEHLGNNRIVHTDTPFVSDTDRERLSKYALKEGDIVFSRVGSVDRRSLVRKEEDGWLFSGRCLRVRVNKNLIHPAYLSYFFGLDTFKKYIRSIAVGATMPSINTKILSEVPIYYPADIDKQEKIANLFLSIDDKIQLNHQINQTLEQLAQAIFKSWFVDFEPVRAKMAALEVGGSEEDALLAAMQAISGKDVAELIRFQNEQPDQYNELHTIADLFPSAMQDSEFGEIPEGWKAGSLSNLAVFSSERITKEELTLKTYISTENMLENKNGICDAASLPSSASVPKFESGQILISNIRPYFKKIWFASMSGGRSPDVLGFTCKHERTNEFVFNLLYQDKFFDYMMLTSKGAKMPRGDKKAILQFGCVLPPISLMRLFSDRVKQFYIMINSNKAESIVLTSFRDTLLPKLLSGELTISKSILEDN